MSNGARIHGVPLEAIPEPLQSALVLAVERYDRVHGMRPETAALDHALWAAFFAWRQQHRRAADYRRARVARVRT